MDVDGNGVLEPASTDRVVERDYAYQQNGADWFDYSATRTYLTDNGATATDVEQRRERLSNFASAGAEKTLAEVGVTDEEGNVTVGTTSVDRAAKKVTMKTVTPDSTVPAVRVSVNGLLQSSAPATPQPATTYAYDGLGRRVGVTDARGYVDASGGLASVTTPAGMCYIDKTGKYVLPPAK
jgi:hypothetical protein